MLNRCFLVNAGDALLSLQEASSDGSECSALELIWPILN